MSHRRAEVGVETNQLIEGSAGGGGIALAELRLGEPQHQVGIVLVQPAETLAILSDGLIEAPMSRELLGVALATRDVASDARLAFVAAQIGSGVHCFAEPPRSALRSAAAQQLRNDFHRHIGDRADPRRQQQQHPYPQLIPPGLDDVDDEGRLDQVQ